MELFSSYLPLKTQFTRYKNNISKKATVIAGVPQGSILGSHLFLLFMSHLLPSRIKARILYYTVGTKIFFAARISDEVRNVLEKDLTTTVNSFTEHNILKKLFYVFPFLYTNQGTTLPRAGIWWRRHFLCEIRSRSWIISGLPSFFERLRLKLYMAFIRPLVDYCLPLRSSCLKTLPKKVQKMVGKGQQWNG